MPQPEGAELEEIRASRKRLRERYLRPAADRAATTAAGVHHVALICRDVEETIRFYQEFLGFPLVELVENRDYPGSSHFFFDIGNRNLLGFFDFPGHDHPPFAETIGGSSTSPSRSRPASSPPPDAAWTRPASTTWAPTAGSRTACTSVTPTGSASNSTAKTWACSSATPCSAERDSPGTIGREWRFSNWAAPRATRGGTPTPRRLVHEEG